VEQFMTVEPYSQARRVFLVVDNGSAHRGQRSIERLQGAQLIQYDWSAEAGGRFHAFSQP
jgi:hypothetical protein